MTGVHACLLERDHLLVVATLRVHAAGGGVVDDRVSARRLDKGGTRVWERRYRFRVGPEIRAVAPAGELGFWMAGNLGLRSDVRDGFLLLASTGGDEVVRKELKKWEPVRAVPAENGHRLVVLHGTQQQGFVVECWRWAGRL